MTFNKHVGNVCKACYYHICALWHIRTSVSEGTAQMLVCAIVDSRLNYCNALLTGMSETNFIKLEWVQNNLAHVITGANRRDHITPVLAKLHWLLIRAKVTFKIGMLVYKLRHSHQPYLKVKQKDNMPVRTLRSADMSLLAEPFPPPMSAIGRPAFSYSLLTLWLPSAGDPAKKNL